VTAVAGWTDAQARHLTASALRLAALPRTRRGGLAPVAGIIRAVPASARAASAGVRVKELDISIFPPPGTRTSMPGGDRCSATFSVSVMASLLVSACATWKTPPGGCRAGSGVHGVAGMLIPLI
jgi:hypothetical protein